MPRAAHGRGGGRAEVARRRRGFDEEEQAGQSRRFAHQRLQLSRPALDMPALRTINYVERDAARKAVGKATRNALCSDNGLAGTFNSRSLSRPPPSAKQQQQ